MIPIIRWGKTIEREFSEGWSRVIDHEVTATPDGSAVTVEFPVSIDCTYLNGRYDEYSVARHGYAADAPFTDTPREARYHYSKRFGFEASYRLSERTLTTTTRDSVVRLLSVVVSPLIQKSTGVYVATPRRGGRHRWKLPFNGFPMML